MKSLTRFFGLSLCATLLTFLACGQQKDVGSNDDRIIRPPTDKELALAQSSNQFGFKLLDEVVSLSEGGNVFVSPLSVSMALGMTYNGAKGTTAEGMATALEYGDLTLEEVNHAYRDLINLLTTLDPKVTMEIANSIWYREGFNVLDAFIEVNQLYFDAVVSALDFASPEAAATINAWVDAQTHGKIDSIVEPPISAATVMFLINAVYFKGTWTYEFDEEHTRDDTFHVSGSEQKTVKMMSIEGDFAYLETEDFEAVDLPYGEGLFSMTVFLPKAGTDIDQLIADLNQETFDAWTASLSIDQGQLSLPRFELEYEAGLNDVLAALGMGQAFSPSADFSGINGGGGLFISNVKHKTYVKVNEEGTEAAAVTSVEVGITSAGPEGFVMRVNRPFVFVIHDHHSGALLFMGKIVDPPST
ncbi:serpin family protein [Myxococcota bacterium]